jgi:hypothetical protein
MTKFQNLSQITFLPEIFCCYINQSAADTRSIHEALSLVREQLVCTNRPHKIQPNTAISTAVGLLLCVICDIVRSKAMQNFVQASKTSSTKQQSAGATFSGTNAHKMPVELCICCKTTLCLIELTRRFLHTGIREIR